MGKAGKGMIYCKANVFKNSRNILAKKIVICLKAVLRSDLALIKIGDFSIINEYALIKP